MPSTASILRGTAQLLATRGLHIGTQFAAPNIGPLPGGLDICAAVCVAAEGMVPDEFYADEVASLRLIECSAGAMQAIRAISAVLDTEPCETEIAPGHTVPDYIEHVSTWAMTPPVFETRPPCLSEVIGRILRAADHIDATAVSQAAA